MSNFKNDLKYVPKSNRKKILFISDDIRFHSGIATISREIIMGTAHVYNYAIVGGAVNHPDKGTKLDLSKSNDEVTGLTDSEVCIYPTDGYGNADLIRALLIQEKPDALVFITDPRYYTWLFQIEHEIRQKIPMIYLSIWDCEPAPLYNKEYYRSCDTIMAISKQTEILTKVVLGEYLNDKIIKYVPHGINENHFYKIDESHEKYVELQKFKKDLVGNFEFVLLYNSRNIRRKSTSDNILAFKLFLDSLPKEKADKCCLVLHTHQSDENGTDLVVVIELFLGDRKNQVIFSNPGVDVAYMNMLYNSADATTLISSNEGWGLALTESLMSGTMIIANVTGGMQDQMRFEDEEGNWIKFDESFCSNHFGKYKKCGDWAIPVFPSNMSVQGSIQTPYILDDRADFRDVAKAMLEVYNIDKEDRIKRGLLGRSWVTSDESMMSAKNMCKNFYDAVDETLKTFKPKSRFKVLKIKDRPLKTLKFSVSL